jgi:DNA-binding transcriptional MocR family regulator
MAIRLPHPVPIEIHMFAHMISPRQNAALYNQVANDLRRKIHSGELIPGAELPSEKYLAGEYQVGRDTIRDALQDLRAEGLIVSRRGYRTLVRKLPVRETLVLPPGSTIYARMPTPEELQRFDLPRDGSPVLVVGDEVYPANRYEFRVE